jgi:hypothetical protein
MALPLRRTCWCWFEDHRIPAIRCSVMSSAAPGMPLEVLLN